MKKMVICLACCLFLVNNLAAADSDIHLNSLGFPPSMEKKATIITACSTFAVRNAADSATVYNGKVDGPFHQCDVKQDVRIADFSQVTTTGRYYLEVPGVGRSFDFEISDDVYNFAYYTTMRAFYLWRCGTAVRGEFDGQIFEHQICHMNDGYQDYIGMKDTKGDGAGGWHDAGDHGKYTANAALTVASLFLAWDHFRDNLENYPLDIPDTAPGFPDFLKEIKWETDWLLKMQYPDGSGKISHKLTRLNFEGFVMPEDDTEKRYFTDWSSTATADFVAVMAMAARYFKLYDAKYAKKCLAAAKNSYQFLAKNPENREFTRGEFRTGMYQSDDRDDRLWAAAEMWETTGDAEYLSDIEKRATEFHNKIDKNWDWPDLKNLGMFTYLLSQRKGRNAELLAAIRGDLITVADSIVAEGKIDIYARPLGEVYYWGCNGTLARHVITLQIANMLSPDKKYIDTALDAIGNIFGRNYYGRSYVTGLGHLPPMNPHDRRSGADNIQAPWPGYIVGGGNTARDWKDDIKDFRTNEIAINWQGALVYALAGFIYPPVTNQDQGQTLK